VSGYIHCLVGWKSGRSNHDDTSNKYVAATW